ncbi:hypothetical protein BH09MYX1_BH09MYX1_27640 [soil metagenome]
MIVERRPASKRKTGMLTFGRAWLDWGGGAIGGVRFCCMRSARLSLLLLLPLAAVGCGSTDTSTPTGDGGVTPDAAGDSASTDGGPLAAPGCPTVTSDPDVKQSLPTATVDTTLPTMTGKVVSVMAGGDLQAAIDAAALGDTIELEAGATFTGAFTLPAKTGSGWIIIRTSAPDGQLAMPGTRVSPALASKMAKLASKGLPVFSPAKGAHHYRLIGLEITATAGTYVNSLVDLGVDTAAESELAHDVIVDRCYLHADAVGGRRGVTLNSKSSAVIDSHLSGFREKGADSQAIVGWAGPGPFRIVNNYLEGASENVMFGGADPKIANLVPSDIQICGNHFRKDPTWIGQGWVAKNLLEFKNARRVLVAGNVLENSWSDGQVGFGILFTPRNQDGTAPWSVDSDVTVAYNVLRHVGSGVNLSASDDLNKSQPTTRIVIRDNLIDDVGGATFTGDGRVFQFTSGGGGGSDIKLDHNTAVSAKNATLVLGDTAKYGTNFVFSNNVLARGQYGAFGSGQGEGTKALDFYLVSYSFENNALFGSAAPGTYPATTSLPATASDVGFVDFAGGNYALASSSTFAKAGSDGRDLGADFSVLVLATKNVAP